MVASRISNTLCIIISGICILSGCANGVVEMPEPENFAVSYICGGEVIFTLTVKENAKAGEIDAPKAESPFVGWFLEMDGYYTAYNFDAPVRSDIELYALYENSGHKVTYVSGKEGVDDVVTFVPDKGEAPILFMQDGEDEVTGWYIDEGLNVKYDPSPVTGSLVLYAKWKSMDSDLPPDDPAVIEMECEDGILTGSSEIESHDSASGGNAVNIKELGTITMDVTVPQSGYYRLDVNYLTWSNGENRPVKFNRVGISGITSSRVVDFAGNDVFESLFIGIYELKRGTTTITLSAFWGWTVFDKITLTQVGQPATVSEEFENGVLGGSSYLENAMGGASGGNAVCLGSNGTVSLKMVSPKKASYKVFVHYFGWDGQTKYNYIEIPGHIENTLVTLTGINEYLDLDFGIVSLDEGEEFEIRVTSSWGWTYFDCVTLIEVPEPESVSMECENGILSGCILENPNSSASNGNAVNIQQSGTIIMKMNIPKSALYKCEVRYFTWGSEEKMNKFGITGILEEKEYNFAGTNNYETLNMGRFELPAGEVEVVLSASWGWTYFDKVTFTEVI